MRVLAVTSRCPMPPDRGDAQRLVRLMGELAKNHDVSCVVPCATAEIVSGFGALGISVHGARIAPWAVSGWWRGPAQVAAMARFQAPAALCHDADVIHVSTLRSLAMVPEHHWPKVHLDFVDALSRNTVERAASSRIAPLWRAEARALREGEQRALRAVAAASATSSEDGAVLGPGVRVLPVGTDLPEVVPPRNGQPTVVFTGNLGYFANIDAAKWLALDIFPLVRSRAPDAQLVLAGARPSPDVLRLGRTPGIEVHGDVESLTPFLGAAWVACAPLRFGTGVQFKVLEAAAHARPVVTTSPVAARISGMEAGRDLIAADTTSDLAGAIVDLIQDPAAAEVMGSSARAAVAAAYGWPALASQLEETLTEIAARHQDGPE